MSKNHSVSDQPLLWKDRKRILGLPMSFTRYSIDNDRLYMEIGLLSSRVDELLLYRVLDVSSSQTIGQKMFGVGTITLFSADKTHTNLQLKNVKHPDQVRKMISRLVEDAREKRRLSGSEMFGMANTWE